MFKGGTDFSIFMTWSFFKQCKNSAENAVNIDITRMYCCLESPIITLIIYLTHTERRRWWETKCPTSSLFLFFCCPFHFHYLILLCNTSYWWTYKKLITTRGCVIPSSGHDYLSVSKTRYEVSKYFVIVYKWFLNSPISLNK